MPSPLSKLQERNLRTIWPNEQRDFSAWLASDEGIGLLGDELNLSLVDVQTEAPVGGYRCDIVCRDESSGLKVIVENQLEDSNHDHLGKLITYASGLDAGIVVWIVRKARTEHASAIQWLNEHTSRDVSFFLVEIHAYAIDDSKPAPMFKVIEQPNDFEKVVREKSLSVIESKQYAFWTELDGRLEGLDAPFRPRKPHGSNQDIVFGSPKAHFLVTLVSQSHLVRVALYIKDDKGLFDSLAESKAQIEAATGIPLDWDRKDDLKHSEVSVTVPGLELNDPQSYPDLCDKIADKLVRLHSAFAPHIIGQ